MGSFGDDWKCPACGRVGNGGYIPDGVLPLVGLCTEGDYSCLWFHLVAQDRGPRDILAESLDKIFRPVGGLPPPLYERIGEMLIG